jgi:hypothetical protein
MKDYSSKRTRHNKLAYRTPSRFLVQKAEMVKKLKNLKNFSFKSK